VKPAASPAAGWLCGPVPPPLLDEEVHVWRADLSVSESVLHGSRKLLSEDERNRASRFHFAKDRESFTAARGLLRTLLGMYLERQPASLVFEYGPEGKPRLASETPADPISFNLAHSSTLALVAVTSRLPLGVDVELIREHENWEDLAALFFAAEEVSALRALPARARSSEFFRIWTRKEAYVKGRGQGLSIPLDRFSVVGGVGQPLSAGDSEEAQEFCRWSLHDLEPGAGFRGALAVRGDRVTVRTLRWPPEANPNA
jgi:4'-phosphopantetheinyl transferase